MCFATLATVATIAGTVVSAGGAIYQANANAANANYQSQVAANNALIAKQNADYAIKAGEAKTQQQSMKEAATLGIIKAGQAANGIDVNSGSALDVQTSQREKGQLDSETTMNNAQLQAYGYRTQGTNYEAQSQLYSQQAGQAEIGGILGATGSLLSGAKSVNFSPTSSSSSSSDTFSQGPYSYGAGNYTGFGPFA